MRNDIERRGNQKKDGELGVTHQLMWELEQIKR